jgi:FkbM family methyltransferase
MLSYAQNAEDVVLERAFAEVEEGFYVDVGASDPVNDSVTFHFYERGWQGVNVEPDPDDYEQLVAARPRDLNLQAAVGPGEEPLIFYPSDIRGHGTVNSALAAERGHAATIQVPQISLARIFAQYSPPDGIHFLKVDVEHWETEVLASAELDRFRPRVVVVEAVDDEGLPTHEAWEPALLAGGYNLALFDGVNRFYCREEDADLLLPRLAAPANVLDNWRPAREVNVQTRLQTRLEEVTTQLDEVTRRFADVEAERAAVRSDLDRETDAHQATRRSLAAANRALEDEQQAHETTRRALASVYASTSWRITSPVRDASRLAKLIRRGRGTR